jgi:sulfur relay (sulfurtransferase) complex TusBCD TusD component (DsrE family)
LTALLLVMGPPYESDLTTTLLRLVEAALGAGHRIVVWTCGGATALTQRTLGASKPRNPMRPADRHPSTSRLVAGLVNRSGGALRWYVCRQCMDERGATAQIAEVVVQPPFRFLPCLEEADVCLSLGVK